MRDPSTKDSPGHIPKEAADLCRRIARQLWREDPSLTISKVLAHRDISFACNWKVYDQKELTDIILPMEVPDEELPFYQEVSAWQIEEAIAIWNGVNPFILALANGENRSFWSCALVPTIRERIATQTETVKRAAIAKTLDAVFEGQKVFVSPRVFYFWAIENLGTPLGHTVIDFFDELKRNWGAGREAGHDKLDPVEETSAPTSQTNPLDIFRSMEGLRFHEITLTFVGEASSAVANTMLEVYARTQKRRISLGEFGLADRRSGKLNTQAAALIGIANSRTYKKSSNTGAKVVSRIRELLQEKLGVSEDPFHLPNSTYGWLPKFTVMDQRGKADDRARQKAERATESLEALSERGRQFAAPGEEDAGDDEEDLAAAWLRENDPGC